MPSLLLLWTGMVVERGRERPNPPSHTLTLVRYLEVAIHVSRVGEVTAVGAAAVVFRDLDERNDSPCYQHHQHDYRETEERSSAGRHGQLLPLIPGGKHRKKK